MRLSLAVCAATAAGVAHARSHAHSQGLSTGFCTNQKQLAINPICMRRNGTADDVADSDEPRAKTRQFLLPKGDWDSAYWNYQPKCIQVEGSIDRYCVFNSNSFANGRGISFFTTPEMAKYFIQTPAFQDATALSSDEINEPVPNYNSMPLPGRGIGLISNTTMRRGDRLFSHTPAFVVHEGTFEAFTNEERIPFQRLAIERLPKYTKTLFLNLHGHFGGDPVEDIINTNSFHVETKVHKDYAGELATYATEQNPYVVVNHNVVLPETSRMNHDCRPNAHYYFDSTTLSHHVHALSTIVPGEEITISYIDPSMSRKDRLRALNSSWGFKCACSACTQRRLQTDASDERLALMHSIVSELEDWTSASMATPELGELLISLYSQERLNAPIADAYAYTALEYNGVGDRVNAVRMASLAYEAGLLYGGPYEDDVIQMQHIVRSAETHWSWLARIRRRKWVGDDEREEAEQERLREEEERKAQQNIPTISATPMATPGPDLKVQA